MPEFLFGLETILNQIDQRITLRRFEDSCMVYRLECLYPFGIKNMCNPHYKYLSGFPKKTIVC
jgi:hypothetical protein